MIQIGDTKIYVGTLDESRLRMGRREHSQDRSC
jgi:hypothetical protein